MINGDFTSAKSLTEFYDQIRKCHEDAHGKDYVAVHDALTNLIAPKTTYRELGVNQGATAAAVLLKKPVLSILIDRDLSNWKPYAKLFMDFALENEIALESLSQSSLDIRSVRRCDVLYIDTTHRPDVLARELEMHHGSVSKHIVCHDTEAKLSLFTEIERFCNLYPWKVVERNRTNVGYTILEKI